MSDTIQTKSIFLFYPYSSLDHSNFIEIDFFLGSMLESVFFQDLEWIIESSLSSATVAHFGDHSTSFTTKLLFLYLLVVFPKV